jgi:predicted ATPase/DNA-binding CsgD family transcriptional regulator
MSMVQTALLRDDVRLVTLTGPGGTGKTRLALEAAAQVAEHFAHGVCFVDLAPVSDPAQLIPAIAAALGIVERQAPLMDELCAHLQAWPLLLLLDNVEQLLEGAPLIAELLGACADLTVLVTSRAPLEVRGEHEITVPPLAVPDPSLVNGPDGLERYSAVALFLDRASSVQASFRLTSENARAVATICARLDGLPLALELAAARIRMLPPEALAARLDHALPILTGGPRDLPARQRTLRDAIAWSYALLDAQEQRVFRALAVFVGGFMLDAAEAVLTDDIAAPVDVLDVVSHLVARNLVRQIGEYDGEPRFGLLETIREFGLERLEAAGETAQIRDRHLVWALSLAGRTITIERGPASVESGAARGAALDRAEADLDNMRAALAWSVRSNDPVGNGLRLARALSMSVWTVRGYQREGSSWLDALLHFTLPGSRARGLGLVRLGYLLLRQNQHAAACRAFAEAQSIWESEGDTRQLLATLPHYGIARYHSGEHTAGQEMLEAGLRLAQDVGDRPAERVCLRNLADIHIDSGNYAAASTCYGESLAIARAAGDDHDTAYALRGIGHIARVQGQYARAAACLRESVALLRPLRDRRCLPLSLEGLACIAVGADWAERAVRVLGAVHTMQERSGAPSPPSALPDYERTLADARSQLGTERFMVCWAEGTAMSLDEVVELALAAPLPNDQPAIAERVPSPAGSRVAVPLSAREREVVALIAQGRSNREIAGKLVLSVRTVERHIENVYNRLGITGKAGRAIVTAYALRHHLVEPGAPV